MNENVTNVMHVCDDEQSYEINTLSFLIRMQFSACTKQMRYDCV